MPQITRWKLLVCAGAQFLSCASYLAASLSKPALTLSGLLQVSVFSSTLLFDLYVAFCCVLRPKRFCEDVRFRAFLFGGIFTTMTLTSCALFLLPLKPEMASTPDLFLMRLWLLTVLIVSGATLRDWLPMFFSMHLPVSGVATL